MGSSIHFDYSYLQKKKKTMPLAEDPLRSCTKSPNRHYSVMLHSTQTGATSQFDTALDEPHDTEKLFHHSLADYKLSKFQNYQRRILYWKVVMK